MSRPGVRRCGGFRLGDNQVDHRGDDAMIGTPGGEPENLPLGLRIRMNLPWHAAIAKKLRHRLQVPCMRRDSAKLDVHLRREQLRRGKEEPGPAHDVKPARGNQDRPPTVVDARRRECVRQDQEVGQD